MGGNSSTATSETKPITVQPKSSEKKATFNAVPADDGSENKGALKRLYPEHEVAVIVTDRTAKVLYANPMTYRFLGYLANELVGHSIEQLFPEKFRKFHQERVAAYVKRQEEGRNWIASDIMDRARMENVMTKNGELIQVVITLTDLGRQDQPGDAQFILTLKPSFGKRQAS